MLNPFRLSLPVLGLHLLSQFFIPHFVSSQSRFQKPDLLLMHVSNLTQCHNVIEQRFFVWQVGFVNLINMILFLFRACVNVNH